MKRFIFIAVVMFSIGPVGSLAQLVDQAEIQSAKSDYLGLQPAIKPFSLIDLSRVKWSQSYSVTFFSGGGTSGQVGLYTSSLFYEFTPSLSLDINLGIAHNPGALINSATDAEAQFYPAFNLDYHPSDNFRLSIGFAHLPGGYYNPYSYYYPYNYWANDWRRRLLDD